MMMEKSDNNNLKNNNDENVEGRNTYGNMDGISDHNGMNHTTTINGKTNTTNTKKKKQPNSIRNGWFSEIEPAWPGQRLSLALEVSYILFLLLFLTRVLDNVGSKVFTTL